MNVLPAAKLRPLNFCTMIVFGPIWLIESRSDLSNPRMSDVMPTIDVMPITTPSTVSAERILLVRSVSIDMPTISRMRPERRFAISVTCPCPSRVQCGAVVASREPARESALSASREPA